MKRVLLTVGVLCLALLVSGSIGSAEELSFSQAVSLMEDHNIDLKIARLNREVAQIDYDKAIASNLMTDSNYSKLQAEYNLERAQNTYLSARNSHYLDLFRKYNDVLSAERNLAISQIELEVAEHSYKIVTEKVGIGDAGRLDQLRELNRLETARLNLTTAEDSLAEAKRVLENVLGLEQLPVLTSRFDLPELTLSLEDSLETARINSFDIWERDFNLKLQTTQLEKQQIDNTPPIDVRKTELNTRIAELNLEKAIHNLEEQVIISFQGLAQSLAQYQGRVRDLEIAEESYNISKRQAEVGIITETQLLDAKLSLLRAMDGRESTIVAYTISYLQFQELLGLDGVIND